MYRYSMQSVVTVSFIHKIKHVPSMYVWFVMYNFVSLSIVIFRTYPCTELIVYVAEFSETICIYHRWHNNMTIASCLRRWISHTYVFLPTRTTDRIDKVSRPCTYQNIRVTFWPRGSVKNYWLTIWWVKWTFEINDRYR